MGTYLSDSGPRPFDHHDEEDSALVPTTNPAPVPAIDAIAQCDRLEKAQELGLNFHTDSSITLSGWTVKVTTTGRTRRRRSLIA